MSYASFVPGSPVYEIPPIVLTPPWSPNHPPEIPLSETPPRVWRNPPAAHAVEALYSKARKDLDQLRAEMMELNRRLLRFFSEETIRKMLLPTYDEPLVTLYNLLLDTIVEMKRKTLAEFEDARDARVPVWEGNSVDYHDVGNCVAVSSDSSVHPEDGPR